MFQATCKGEISAPRSLIQPGSQVVHGSSEIPPVHTRGPGPEADHMTDVLTPEELVKSIEAGLMAERKRLQEANGVVRDSSLRIRKAERLLKSIRRIFDLPGPGHPFVAHTTPRPPGVEVVDENGDRLYFCDREGCTFSTRYPTGLGPHRAAHARQESRALTEDL
jgi:hypothetical protein